MNKINLTAQEFQDVAEIEATFFLMKQMLKENEKPIHPVHRIIDLAIGFSKKKEKENIKVLIYWTKRIIKLKKRNGISINEEKKLLNQLNKLNEGQ